MKKTLIIIIGILYLGCNETSQTTSNSADVQTSQIGLEDSCKIVFEASLKAFVEEAAIFTDSVNNSLNKYLMKCSDNLEYTEAFESKFKNIDCLPEYVSAPTKSICQDGGKLIRRYDIDSIPYSYSRFNHLTEFLSSDRHIVDFGLCVRFLYTTKGICIEKSTDGPMSLTSLSPRISLDFLGENSKLTKQKMRLRIKSKTNSGIECYFYQFSKILKNGSYFTGNAYYSCGNIENVKLNGF